MRLIFKKPISKYVSNFSIFLLISVEILLYKGGNLDNPPNFTPITYIYIKNLEHTEER